MNTAVIVKRFDDDLGIAMWANSLIGNYMPEDTGFVDLLVNSIVSIQVITDPSIPYFLAVLLVEVWLPGTEE